VNRVNFNELLGDIENINASDIASLEALKKQYPYFQNLHLLLAKAYKQNNAQLLKPSLNSAAVYSVDRGYLKKILNKEHQFVEVIQTKPTNVEKPNPTIILQPKKETIKEVQPEQDESKQIVKVGDKPVVREARDEVDSIETTAKKVSTKRVVDKDIYVELDENLRQYNERKKIMQALLADTTPVKASVTEPKIKKAKNKESQIQLIEKFIKNEPQMEKKNLLTNESKNDQEDLAAKKITQSDKFLTETLAKLLTEQKKYSKAIEIYKKLMLKFPKKTTYFAAQIEKINQRGNV